MTRVSGRIGIPAAAVLLLATSLALPSGATTLPPLTGVRSVTGGGAGSCALLTSGKVDCWGLGQFGQLGNGKFYTTGEKGSSVSVAVEGMGGTGTLGGVASVTGADYRCVLSPPTRWTAGATVEVASRCLSKGWADLARSMAWPASTTLAAPSVPSSPPAGWTAGDLAPRANSAMGRLTRTPRYRWRLKGWAEPARSGAWPASTATASVACARFSPPAGWTAGGLVPPASSATGRCTETARTVPPSRWRSRGLADRARSLAWPASPRGLRRERRLRHLCPPHLRQGGLLGGWLQRRSR